MMKLRIIGFLSTLVGVGLCYYGIGYAASPVYRIMRVVRDVIGARRDWTPEAAFVASTAFLTAGFALTAYEHFRPPFAPPKEKMFVRLRPFRAIHNERPAAKNKVNLIFFRQE